MSPAYAEKESAGAKGGRSRVVHEESPEKPLLFQPRANRYGPASSRIERRFGNGFG